MNIYHGGNTAPKTGSQVLDQESLTVQVIEHDKQEQIGQHGSKKNWKRST